jgi:hypothetical protein
MAFDQVENPPNHADTAPPGEIRTEPPPVLRRFTLGIVTALLLPSVAFFLEGYRSHRTELIEIGFAFLVLLGGFFAVLLWKIISSRTNRPGVKSRSFISVSNDSGGRTPEPTHIAPSTDDCRQSIQIDRDSFE